MKKLSWLLVIAMLMSMFAFCASAEGEYSQAPMLDELVANGTIPPVEERLPVNPRSNVTDYLPEEMELEVGEYGGTIRMAFNSVNWNPDVFVGMTENLCNMASMNSGIVEPNLVEDYQISDDLTTYTFTLREGLKWSDGTPVTMDDFKFTIENFVFNEELTPSIANWMTVDGVPFEFTVIDDMTFELKFDAPYGAFSTYICCSGFNGYTDLLKPAYYLKPFHKDFAEECHGSLEAYYEFLAPYGAAIGYDDVTAEGVWTYIFNQVDMTAWECTDPVDCLTTETFPGLIDTNFPQLYPWVMISSVNDVQLWERNYYYHKVDAAGQQLPYADYVQNTLVQDGEMVQMSVITGEVDFLRESATIDNISMYRENADQANINPLLCTQGNTPTDFYFNVNYGLNSDGTVKDDDASKAWQEVINDVRFRRAMAMSVDADEIIDTVYNGLGVKEEGCLCDHDIDGANALLDEMGMMDIDGDGFRETPSGLPFQFMIWNASEATDIVPTCELYAEYFGEIGINVGISTVESSLLGTSVAANEVPARVIWAAFGVIWYFDNTYSIGTWAPLWSAWYNAGCPEEGDYLIPTEEKDKAMIETFCDLMTYDVEEITSTIRPSILKFFDEDCYMIRPISEVKGIVVLNGNMRNFTDKVITHSLNYYLEDIYFAQ